MHAIGYNEFPRPLQNQKTQMDIRFQDIRTFLSKKSQGERKNVFIISILCKRKVNCNEDVHCLCLGVENDEVEWLNGVI